MHVINYPDSLGLACDVCQHCIPLPAYHIAGVPNHPNYFLGAEPGSVCDSLSTAIPFTGLPSANEYVLFPNPARDKIYIQSGSRMNVHDVTLYL